MQPDLTRLDPVIDQADRNLATIAERIPAEALVAQQQLAALQGEAIREVAARYQRDPPPANFRVNVNPLVTWIWIGWLALVGALIALWPTAGAGEGSRTCTRRDSRGSCRARRINRATCSASRPPSRGLLSLVPWSLC